jgi:hypothetical protein
MKYLCIALMALLATAISACHKKVDRSICGKYAGKTILETAVMGDTSSQPSVYDDTLIVEDANKGKSFHIYSSKLTWENNLQFDYSPGNQYSYNKDDFRWNASIIFFPTNDSLYLHSDFHISAAGDSYSSFSGKKI